MADEQKPEGAAKPPAAAPAAPKAPAVLAMTPWESDLARQIQQAFPDQVSELVTTVGQSSLVVKPDAAIPVLEYLKLEGEFDYLVDITAVDYPAREHRFDLVYILYSFARNERIRVKARIALGYKPATSIPVYATSDWLEREVFDMFGIEFANHPNMRRILMPEEWEGFPLRKDYGIIQMDNRWVKENLGIESGQ